MKQDDLFMWEPHVIWLVEHECRVHFIGPCVTHVMHQIWTQVDIYSDPHYQSKECAPNSGCSASSECHVAIDMLQAFEGVDLLNFPKRMHRDAMVCGRHV